MKNEKKNHKKTGCSCFEAKPRREYNPVEHIARWGRNIKHACQRIRYGYCERDVWSIDWWFLSVVPNMLEELRETAHGYPGDPGGLSHALTGTGAPEEIDEAGMKKWEDILSEMIFLFREAHEETCTRKNSHQAEYERAYAEFEKKYGMFGEKLMTEADKAEEKEKGLHRMYMLSDAPEYTEIAELHFAEEREIDRYRSECKDKGLDLFKKWFWNLWD